MPPTTATRARAANRVALAPEGIATAIVAVTGVVDEVEDLIVPGAFAATLAERKVKFVFAHDWKDPLGRVLHIEEWKPGDPRLPKKTPQGKPWPKEAGALVASVQFNLDVQRCRDIFAIVKQWAEHGEAFWSIGYRVKTSLATRRRDGVRVIYGLDLFEVSPVLHGANAFTSTLEVKHNAEHPDHEFKISVPSLTMALPADVEFKYDTSPMGEPGNQENWVDQQGGLPSFIRAVAHALEREGHTEQGAIRMAIGAMKRWAGGGDDVTPKTRAKAAAALAQWEKMKAGAAADRAKHKTESKGAVEPRAAGVAIRAADTGRLLLMQRSITDDKAPGRWEWPGGKLDDGEHPLQGALREFAEETGIVMPPSARVAHEWTSANGVYRGYLMEVPTEADVPVNLSNDEREQTNPDDPDGDEMGVLAWWRPNDLPNMPALRNEVARQTPWRKLGAGRPRHPVQVKAAASVQAARAQAPVPPAPALFPTLESKMMPHLPGSYEARRALVDQAATELLCRGDETKPNPAGEGPGLAGWVCIEGLFEDHAIITHCNNCGEQKTYTIPYTIDGDQVSLGTPEEVTLSVVATAADTDDDEDTSPTEADIARVRYLNPAAANLESVASMILLANAEQKVFSDALLTSLCNVMDALEAKGMNVDALFFDKDDDEDEDEKNTTREKVPHVSGGSPQKHTPGTPDEDDDEDEKKRRKVEEKGADPGEGIDATETPVEPAGDSELPTAEDIGADETGGEDEGVELDPAEIEAEMKALRAS